MHESLDIAVALVSKPMPRLGQVRFDPDGERHAYKMR